MGMDRRVFNAKPGFLIRNSILKCVHNLRGFVQSARMISVEFELVHCLLSIDMSVRLLY